VPLLIRRSHPQHLGQLEDWLKAIGPEELFDAHGALIPELAQLAPLGTRRMGLIRMRMAACC
jgi:xylulose-5-phosphate/fructose-6-phosphate phosphoketolase